MKLARYIIALFTILLVLSVSPIDTTKGQCAMCSLNAENGVKEGNGQAKGINNGVYFLLGSVFLMGGGIAFLWYKKFRKVDEKPSVL